MLSTSGRSGSGTGTMSASRRNRVCRSAGSCRASSTAAPAPDRTAAYADTGIDALTSTTNALSSSPAATNPVPATTRLTPRKAATSSPDAPSPRA
jgi:hypothetical protein